MTKKNKEILRHTNIYPLLIIYSVCSAAVWSILVIIVHFEKNSIPWPFQWLNEIFLFPATFFHLAGNLLELGDVLGNPLYMFSYLFIPYIFIFYAIFKKYWKRKRYS